MKLFEKHIKVSEIPLCPKATRCEDAGRLSSSNEPLEEGIFKIFEILLLHIFS